MTLASVRSGALIFCVLTLTACGGGGGGDGGGSGAPPASQRLTLSTNQLNFGAAKNGAAAGQEISGTISGSPQAVYITIAHTADGIAAVSQPLITGERATSIVTPRNPSTLQEGVYQDTITVTACPNQACTTQFSGSPQTVNVTYVVGIATNPSTISAQAIEGRSPAPQSLELRYFGGTAPWSAAPIYSSGNGWLTVQQSSTTDLPANASLAFAPLANGSYTASLRVSVAPGTGRAAIRDVPVVYTVLPLLDIATPAAFVVTNEQPAAGQNRSVVVGTRDPARQTAWTAQLQSPTPWLTLSAAAGNAANGDAFRVELVPAEVAKLRNGTQIANVVVTSAAADAAPVIVPVRIDLDRTHVSTVAPYVAGSNRQAVVSIRGNRFDAAAISNVMFGTTPSAAPIQVVSEERIVATHPALPAGRYPVTLVMNNGVTPGTSAELVVQDSMSYATAANFVSGPPSLSISAVFDPERASCYFIETTGITAVKREPTGWTAHSYPFSAPFTSLSGASLSTDGRELFLLANSNLIVHLDPATMQETRRFNAGTQAPGEGRFGAFGRALEGNEVGFDLDRSLRRYDPARNAAVEFGQLNYSAYFYYSRIGNRVVYDIRPFGSGSELFIVDPLGGSAVPFFTTSSTLRELLSTTLADRWALVGESSHSYNEVVLTDARGTEVARFEAAVEDAVLSAAGNRFIYTATRRVNPSSYDPGIRILDLTGIAPGVVPPETHELPLPLSNLYAPMHLTPDESEVVFCSQTRVTAVALPPP